MQTLLDCTPSSLGRGGLKRTLLKLVVFLLLGAIINVAVAWGCAVAFAKPRSTPFSLQYGKDQERDPLESEWVKLSEFGKSPRRHECYEFMFRIFHSEGFGARERLVTETSRRLQGDCRDDIRRKNNVHEPVARFVDSGWPMLSMAGFQCWGWDAPREGIEIRNSQARLGMKLLLPVLPRWPGFAINTIFYVTALWMLFTSLWLPGKIRRFIRIRGQRCPACGYKIAEKVGPACSECGHSLSKHPS